MGHQESDTGAERKSQIWFGLHTGSPELGLRSVTLPRDFTDSWNVVRTNQQQIWVLEVGEGTDDLPCTELLSSQAHCLCLSHKKPSCEHWLHMGTAQTIDPQAALDVFCTNRGKGTFRAGPQPTGLHHPPRRSQTHPPTLGLCPVGACSPGVQTDTGGEALDLGTALSH